MSDKSEPVEQPKEPDGPWVDPGADDRTVHERMWAVLAELPAIGKTQENSGQGFKFRGHDQVLNALNPLLAKHGVFVVPRVLERVATDTRTTEKGKTMYEVNLHVGFDFYGASGDSIFASAWGEGTDMGDKATSKAHTMAFKTVIAESFAVSTEEDYDPDSSSPEQTSRGGHRSNAQAPRGNRAATTPPAVRASSWAEWMSLMKDYGVVEAESKEWLNQAVFAIGLDKEKQANEMFTRANAALAKIAEHEGGVLFIEGARKIVQEAFASAFDGQIVPGPEWRLDPTEGDRLTQHEWEQAKAAEEAEPSPESPEAQTDDIPFGAAPTEQTAVDTDGAAS